MPLFIDPTGLPSFGIALCARCSKKFPIVELSSDPNYPGLMVCKEDLDQLDPYRLPARQTERINLDFVRPDVPLTGTQAPFVLPTGFIITEDGVFVISEAGEYLQTEGESDIETESLLPITSEDGIDLLVEPWV